MRIEPLKIPVFGGNQQNTYSQERRIEKPGRRGGGRKP